MAPVTEKIWTVLGPEFGENAESKAILVHALSGLNISGAAFLNHLADFMYRVVFLPCPADLNIF